MENIEITEKDGKLTIIVDLTKESGPSASGKSITIASTHGNVKLEGGATIGLNVYKAKGAAY